MLSPRQIFEDNIRPADLLLKVFRLAEKLGRTEEEIKKTLDATVKRRNDIVHRADRSQEDPAGPAQEIGFPWAKQAVETIRVVCLALDDLVTARLKELKEQAAAAYPQEVA